MNRRHFIKTVSCAGAAIAAAGTARAALTSLGPQYTAYGLQPVQRAYVQRPTRIVQQCPQWCWAASCAMIFSMFGHPTDQMQIVNRVFRGLACAPAPAGITMAQVLSDSWTDMGGNQFDSQLTAAYDAQAGVNAITNAFIIDQLAQDRPILYANTHHAMVVVSADFIQAPGQPVVISVGVLDPWPASPAYHPLSVPEIVAAQLGGQMTFLAAVDVT